ncbi:MAG: hypothetical protein WBQ94_06540 [Terracidiphilus sp.]
MKRCPRRPMAFHLLLLSLLHCIGILPAPAQQIDESTIIQRIDAAAHARYDNVISYTVTEHYSVFRGNDETHPAAEMTVKTLYRRGIGKDYTILSQSGSGVIQKFVLAPLLDSEKNINLPGNIEKSWFTSANYEMKLKPGGVQQLDGRNCLAVSMTPKHKAPNMIEGTLWADAQDGSIVQIEGVASKSPSFLSEPPKVMRHYTNMNGFSMATHARGQSGSLLFGTTIITIDYQGYQVQLLPAK